MRARNDQHSDVIGYAAPSDHACSCFEIAEARVRAAADEDDVDGRSSELLAGLHLHVVEGFREGLIVTRRRRHGLVDRDDHARVRAERDHRLHCRDVEINFPIERRIGITRELAPARDSSIPCFALRRHFTSNEILVGRVIGRHHARTRTRFDGHIANCHSLIHRQCADRGAAVLHGVSGTTVDTDFTYDAQHDVFGRHAGLQSSVQVDCERLGLSLQHRLSREDVRDLGRADAECECTERAVCARVRVTADDGLSRLGRTELRADDVDDAAIRAREVFELDTEIAAVFHDLANLSRCGCLADDVELAQRADGHGRDRVIHRRERSVGPPSR